MIVHLEQFVAAERPFWEELADTLDRLDRDPAASLRLDEVRRLHYLYQRAAGDLAKVKTFASEPDLQHHLEALVARAYGEVHEVRHKDQRFSPRRWFFGTFPRTFRRHHRAFQLAVAITLLGSLFGAGALAFDPDSKPVLMPFGHLLGDPSERVRMEEEADEDRLEGQRSAFSGMLMTHNTRVSITTMAFGLTYGAGTAILLFYNGVILGAVCFDYLQAGEGVFLTGWLLPHGSVEIPAIVLAGQCGLIIASALIGWRSRLPLRARLRAAAPDITTLIFGVAVLLVWAGIVEAFFSQYHEPHLPYWLKILFGSVQLVLLVAFLTLSGRGGEESHAEADQD